MSGIIASVSSAISPVRIHWESAPDLAQVGTISVCADATLYYRADLHRRAGLGDSVTQHARAAELIAQAWQRRGMAALPLLEGDFAFVLFDGSSGQLVAARDHVGGRSLFYSHHGGLLRVASTVGGILADATVPRDINLATLTSVAAGLWAHSPETAYAAVRELPSGHVLTWKQGESPVVRPFWSPPTTIATRRRPLDPAADELRALLTAAVTERLDPEGVTAVSLSGGWDSSSVYGIAQSIVQGDATRRIQGISISYPEGDPGREDEYIRQITDFWKTTPEFLDVDTIPLLVDPVAHARTRDLPFAHTYEHWNRTLSARARRAGARVILDGFGGDQLFQVSAVYLNELFRSGQWVELARQLKQNVDGGASWRDRFKTIVRPTLPMSLQRRLSRHGPPPPHYLTRDAPPWFRPEFLATHRVREREVEHQPSLPSGNLVLAETHAFLRFAFYPRVRALLHQFGTEQGLEIRSPLLDGRVLDFAARRPWSDRADGPETKRLLRRAVRDVLPATLLAPRPHRTGTTNAYFLRTLRAQGAPVMKEVLPQMTLAEMGMIDANILRLAWEHVLAHDDDELAGRVFFTLQAELWMRGRTR